jgi:hypothetical protein
VAPEVQGSTEVVCFPNRRTSSAWALWSMISKTLNNTEVSIVTVISLDYADPEVKVAVS